MKRIFKMTNVSNAIFREYDIRGEYGKDLTPETQHSYRQRGWTEQEWSSKVGARG